MEEKWKILVYGVRGSYPVPDKDFLVYGGNTSCMALDYGDGIIIFDAGTGLYRLGMDLNKKKIKRADILLSHLHMDHLSGLFGFPLLLDPEAEIHFYGQAGSGIFEYLHLLLGKPFWPVGLKEAAAHIEIHEVMPGKSFYLTGRKGVSGENPFQAGKEDMPGRIKVDTFQGNHPGGSLLYRVEAADKRIVYALDCEMDEGMPDALAEFSKGSDLIIWDAAFAPEDLENHKGWGHSTWEQGSALRRRAGLKKALMTHYSQGYTDDFLQRQEFLAKRADEASCFAREGMVIEL